MSMPSYFVYREVVPGEQPDPSSRLHFIPPKGSDELFFVLKAAFPEYSTHSERMREAVINFLREEQDQAPDEVESLLFLPTLDEVSELSLSRTTSNVTSGETIHDTLSTDVNKSPQSNPTMPSTRPAFGLESHIPSPPPLADLLGVFPLAQEVFTTETSRAVSPRSASSFPSTSKASNQLQLPPSTTLTDGRSTKRQRQDSACIVSKKRSRRIPNGYHCPDCPAHFDLESDLKHHRRNHIPKGTRPYPCPECGARFLYPKDLKRHDKKHLSAKRPHGSGECHTPGHGLAHLVWRNRNVLDYFRAIAVVVLALIDWMPVRARECRMTWRCLEFMQSL